MQGSSGAKDAENGPVSEQEAGRFFRRILETVPFGAVVASTKLPGRFLYVNPEFTRITGYTLDDVADTATWLSAAYPDPEYHAHARDNWARDVSAENMGADVRYRVRCADGSDREVQFRAALLEFDCMVVTLYDVTSHKQAERDWQESEMRHRLLVDQLPSGIVVHSEGEIVFANAAAQRMVGAESSDEIVGKQLSDFVHRDFLAVVEKRIQAVYQKQGHLQPLEERFLRVDGESFPVEVRAVMTDFGDRPASLVLFSDISGRKRDEEARQSLEEQVRYAQKMESLGVLAGGGAHDFNNLLMTMLGNAEMALSELPSGSQLAQRVEAIQSSARRAADLAKQMLDYSGKGRFDIRQSDVHEVFSDIADLVEVTVAASKGVLHKSFAMGLPPVEGDVGQLRQVVMNLVVNACESFDDRHGTITLRTGLVELGRNDLLGAFGADDLPGGAYVYFEVEDDGAGIEEKALPRIFDPFFTTKFTGRGLGLAAVLGIVRAHAGAIHVTSVKGEGATFRVLLPATESENEPVQQTLLPDHGNMWRAGGKVLVVDDDSDVRLVVSVMLKRAGFEVVTAESGPVAIDHYRENGQDIRCVLLDLTMPEVDGYETYVGLREIDDDITVILSSGYNERESIDRFGATPPRAFIQKPYTYEDLVSILQRTLA